MFSCTIRYAFFTFHHSNELKKRYTQKAISVPPPHPPPPPPVVVLLLEDTEPDEEAAAPDFDPGVEALPAPE
jgi:hypothetical protein